MKKTKKKVVVKDKELPKKKAGKVKGGIGLLLPAIQPSHEAAKAPAGLNLGALASKMQKV